MNKHLITINFGRKNNENVIESAYCSCGQNFKTEKEAWSHSKLFNEDEDEMSYEKCYSCPHSTTYRKADDKGLAGFKKIIHYLEIFCHVTGKSIKIDKCPR